MAGLLDTIARQLMGKKSSATVKTTSKTPIKVKPAATSTADTWVKNSTIVNPAIVKPVESELSTEQIDTKETAIEPVKTVQETQTAQVEAVQGIQEIQIEETVIVPVPTAIDRTIKRERTNKVVEKEDYLLTQIDEFREKAQQLQNLLLTKESKVMELQTIVDEREGKARELEHILNERQRKADGITAEVSKQIDVLIEKVTAKMDEIGVSIGKDVAEGQKLIEEQMEELKETFATVNAQLETLKAELSDKVHTENVKCYRNISDLFKDMDEQIASIQRIEQKVEKKAESVHKCTIALIVLTVINMLGVLAVILMEMGVFHM